MAEQHGMEDGWLGGAPRMMMALLELPGWECFGGTICEVHAV